MASEATDLMLSDEDFEDIRPYQDSEVPEENGSQVCSGLDQCDTMCPVSSSLDYDQVSTYNQHARTANVDDA